MTSVQFFCRVPHEYAPAQEAALVMGKAKVRAELGNSAVESSDEDAAVVTLVRMLHPRCAC